MRSINFNEYTNVPLDHFTDALKFSPNAVQTIEMSDDESSFVILGSTPTPSMEQYNGDVHSMTKENGSSNSMLSSTQTIKTFDTVNSLVTSQLSANKKTDSLKNDSPGNPMENKDKPLQPSIMSTSTASKADFAEQFLLGEIPADSLKVSK